MVSVALMTVFAVVFLQVEKSGSQEQNPNYDACLKACLGKKAEQLTACLAPCFKKKAEQVRTQGQNTKQLKKIQDKKPQTSEEQVNYYAKKYGRETDQFKNYVRGCLPSLQDKNGYYRKYLGLKTKDQIMDNCLKAQDSSGQVFGASHPYLLVTFLNMDKDRSPEIAEFEAFLKQNGISPLSRNYVRADNGKEIYYAAYWIDTKYRPALTKYVGAHPYHMKWESGGRWYEENTLLLEEGDFAAKR